MTKISKVKSSKETAEKKIRVVRSCINPLKEEKQKHMHSRLISLIVKCMKDPDVTAKKCGLKEGEMKKCLTFDNFKKLKPVFA